MEFLKLEDRIVLTAGTGLQAQYYSDPGLEVLDFAQIDSAVNFDWGSGSYDASGPTDHFSVRWTGQVESQFTETYSFIVNANDGAKLWVNGQLLIDQFASSSVADATANIDLIAGRRYDIQLEFREEVGAASVRLEWSSPSLARDVIPTDRLYPANRGSISSETWSGIAGVAVSDLTGDTNFPENPDSVSSIGNFETALNAGNNFGRKISGLLHAPESGPYTFFIAANESAELWLSNSSDPSQKQLLASVSSATAIQDWSASAEQESNVVYLAAGQEYYIEGLHKEASGDDHFAVGWRRPGNIDIEVIQGEHLSPNRPEVRVFSNFPNSAEGSAVPSSFTIARSGGSLNNPLTVNYRMSGQATNGTDYQSLNGSITIPAGSETVTLDVLPLADTDDEGTETLAVEILSSSKYEVGLKSERTAYGNIQDDVALPAGGTGLLAGTALADFTRFGGDFTTVADASEGNVIQAVVTAAAENPWNSQLKQAIAGPVNQGDLLVAEFKARSVGGAGTIAAVFEKASSPFTKSLLQAVPLSDNWVKVQIPFQSLETYATGDASFGFFLGYPVQTVRLTDFQLVNYGPEKALAPETAFNLNNISGTWGISQTVDVTGQTFSVAMEIETQTVPDQFWYLQAVERNEAPVANGDEIKFVFSLRATAGSAPQTNFSVQRTDTYANLFSQTINDLTSDWQAYEISFDADDDFAANGIQAVFNVGYGLQTIEIGGFYWTNEANSFNLEELPKRFPASTYSGRGATDAWRELADTRIANDRKSDVTVNVTDANGDPLSGAVVSLRQTNHEFKFGSAINAYAGKLDPNGNEQALKYQSEIDRLFNTVVFENSLKWPGYLQDPQRGIDGVAWAESKGKYIRGHNLLWPSRNSMPGSVWTEYDSRVAADGLASANVWLDTTINGRIDEMLTQFNGQIPEWDVVNEPWSNHDVMDILGNNIIIDWFQRVRDFDPSIKLTLNDFGIFAANGTNSSHRDSFDYWLGLLRDNNLLDVVGEQSHYQETNLTDISVLGQLINSYSTDFNAPIAITEFDVDTSDEQLQADYLRDYMTMAFSQTDVTEFLHWGFWESSHWLPDASLYRYDFSIKPNGQAYEDLVFGNWWTDAQATTFAGAATINAFRGDYEVFVEYNGQTYTGVITVDGSGSSSVVINAATQPINYDPLLSVVNANVGGDAATQFVNSGVWVEPDRGSISVSATLGDVVADSDGTWSWTFTPEQAYSDQTVMITATDAEGGTGMVSFSIDAETNIVSRGVVYGGSSAFGATEVAPDKVPLLPGQTATFANYTSFSSGLNRVAINVAGAASSTLSPSDFEFRVGDSNDLSSWTLLTGTTSISLPTISVGAPVAGVSQVMLAWPDNEIQNTWLQVVMLANSNTGLSSPDVFYFGNVIAETGNSPGSSLVNLVDLALARQNQSGFSTVPIDNDYDFNRDGRVSVVDIALARLNQSGFSPVNLISPPANRGSNFDAGGKSNSSGPSLGFMFSGQVQMPPFTAFDSTKLKRRVFTVPMSQNVSEDGVLKWTREIDSDSGRDSVRKSRFERNARKLRGDRALDAAFTKDLATEFESFNGFGRTL